MTDRDIGVVGHDSAGFTSQRLRLRKDREFAPERRQFGRLHESEMGLDALFGWALDMLRACTEQPERADHLLTSALPWKFALGDPCDPEPLRLWNGRWELIRPPADRTPPAAEVPDSLIEELSGCQVILFESPTVGAVRKEIVAGLEERFRQPVLSLPPEAIARGAWEAARRHSEKVPVYFDFLPQISTIVQDAKRAKNYDLIPPDAVLPAGTEYRSDRPAKLGLVAGMQEIKVFLKKETDPQPRRAIVELSPPPMSSTTVELHLRQKPAAGRARLTLISDAFRGPINVDWDSADILDRSWEEVIESLTPEVPTIPNRLVLPCGTQNWFARSNRPGLLEILEEEAPALLPDWKRLADKLSQRPEGSYAISSDGELPDGLPPEAGQLLDTVVKHAERSVRDQLRGKSRGNDALRLLTWTFRRCPGWIVPEMIDALELGTGRHAFLRIHQSVTLLLQGIGRGGWNWGRTLSDLQAGFRKNPHCLGSVARPR